MDAAQITAWFKANKVEVLGVGAAAVAGLALLQRKKGAAGVTAGAVAPGTIPAGAVVGTGGAGTYDSSSYDLYNALQDEIGTLAQQSQAAQNEGTKQTGGGGSGASAAVKVPIASKLFAPTGSGQYATYNNGFFEIETDGSLYHLTPTELNKLKASNGGKVPGTGYVFKTTAPSNYTGARNIQQKISKAPAVPSKVSAV